MALESECRGRFTKENVIYTGVGKINAAYNLTKSIAKHTPNIVVNLGSAGSSVFKRGKIVNCTKFVQRDMDVQPLGFQKWVTPFEEDNGAILNYGLRVPNLEEGICGTGDSFWLYSDENKDYDIVDMEAYALASVCKKYEIPFRCFKYISDAGNPKDWTENAAKGVDLFIQKLDEIIK